MARLRNSVQIIRSAIEWLLFSILWILVIFIYHYLDDRHPTQFWGTLAIVAGTASLLVVSGEKYIRATSSLIAVLMCDMAGLFRKPELFFESFLLLEGISFYKLGYLHLRASANLGHAGAQYEMFLQNKNRNFDLAEKFKKRAIESGSKIALLSEAVSLIEGCSTAKRAQGRDYILKLSKDGFIPALALHSFLLLDLEKGLPVFSIEEFQKDENEAMWLMAKVLNGGSLISADDNIVFEREAFSELNTGLGDGRLWTEVYRHVLSAMSDAVLTGDKNPLNCYRHHSVSIFSRHVDEVKNWWLSSDYAASAYYLGRFFEDGSFIPQNYGIAYAWYNAAAADGHKDAKCYRDRIAPLLSQSDRERFSSALSSFIKMGDRTKLQRRRRNRYAKEIGIFDIR